MSKKLIGGMSLGLIAATTLAGYLIYRNVKYEGGEYPPAYRLGDTVEVTVSIGEFSYPLAYGTVQKRDWRPSFHEWEDQWWYFVENEEGTTAIWLPGQILLPA